MTTGGTAPAPARLLIVLSLTVVYGFCYAAIKAGLSSAPPLLFAGLRAMTAGAALLALAAALRRPLLPRSAGLGPLLALSLTATTITFAAMFLSPGRTGAGIASVLGNTQPLFAVVLAALFLGERLTRVRLTGLALGLLGVALIAAPAFAGPGKYGLSGPLLALAASAGAAAGSVIVKRVGTSSGILAISGWQLLIGSVPLLALSAVVERGAVVWSREFTALLLFLALAGTAFAFPVWYWLLKRDEVGRLTLFLFLVPVFGLAIAAVTFGERIGPLEGIGVVVALTGIWVAGWESRGRGSGLAATLSMRTGALMAASLRGVRGHRKDAPLIGGTALTALGMGLLVPILPAYASSLGAGPALVGLLLAGFGLTRLLVALPAAWLARRTGRRRLLVGSPAVIAAAAALCAAVFGFWPLALFCLVEGGTAAVYATVGTAAIAGDAGPKNRGRSLAAYQAAGLFGASLGPVVGGLVGQQFGLRAPFLLYAALAALAAWWLHGQLGPDAAPPSGEPPPAEAGSRRIRRLLFGGGLPALWLLTFALVFARVGVLLIIAPLLGAQRLGLSPREIGLALSLAGFAALATFYPAGWLADRFGRKAVILPGGLGMVGALALFAAGDGYAAFLAAAVLLGAGSGLVGPAPTAYLADTVPAEDRMIGVGMHRMLGDAGAALAPPLLGWLAGQDGYESALIAAALLLLTAIGAFAWHAPAAPAVRVTAAPPIPAPTDV